ncbi:MAG: hypothetical protein EAX81_07705 [Candidatus Thorarchaeota archaeon]|nr:hypothetical protein [Candidatus Thorarchaeota archaeon]
MRPRSEWVIYAGVMACIALAIVGGFSYPLIEQGPMAIILFETPVLIGMIAIFILIYKMGPPGS